jgi:hypothetical protein
VSEIQSLASRIQDLTRSVNFWNNMYIASVAVTVIAAVWLFWVQFMRMRRSSVRESLQEQLTKLKDNQSALDIATARSAAALATEKAETANERASKIELEAAQQRERAAKAEHDLLELQQRLAWRRVSPKEYSAFVAALKPYQGSAVEVTKLGEAEAGQFADDLIKMLTDAKWNVSLNISGYVSPPPYGLKCLVNDATPAGKALAAILKSLPTATVESNPKLPTTATILVGLRPPP